MTTDEAIAEAREAARNHRKAFCAVCFVAGWMNCAHFDRCGNVEDYYVTLPEKVEK